MSNPLPRRPKGCKTASSAEAAELVVQTGAANAFTLFQLGFAQGHLKPPQKHEIVSGFPPPLVGGFVFLLSTQSTLNYSAAVFFCINRTHGNNPVILSCHLSLDPTVNPISAFTCSTHASQCLSISFSRVLPPAHRWQHLMLYQSQRTPPTLTGNT